MSGFQLDAAAVRQTVQRARARVREAVTVLGRARAGEGLPAEDAAVLWSARALDADELLLAAEGVRRGARGRPVPLETFAPLYLTNTCDAECRMCGMRAGNRALVRQTASPDAVDEQIRTLARRGMYGVALLTGEYRDERRQGAIAAVGRALRTALSQGFGHVLVNAGSFDKPELETLLQGLPRAADGGLAVGARVTMCTFQETYSADRYRRFMGEAAGNPRADFGRRLANLDRSFAAGFRVANPGILLGLNPDLAFELVALLSHTRHLLEQGMEVYLSVPRLRRIAGSRERAGISDDDLARLVSVLALAEPSAKIVLTTREPAALQRRLVSVVSVLSAGSAAVAPYGDTGASFPLESSQFEVVDQRPFEEILAEHVDALGPVANFRPRGVAAA